LAALRVLVLGTVDIVVFLMLAAVMHIREVDTVVDTVLRRQRGRHMAS
jgi:hypothetical protein